MAFTVLIESATSESWPKVEYQEFITRVYAQIFMKQYMVKGIQSLLKVIENLDDYYYYYYYYHYYYYYYYLFISSRRIKIATE